jgi:hypothetical protein
VSKLHKGSKHDFAIFKEEMGVLGIENAEKLWRIWVDLGFLGIHKHVGKHIVKIPHKKSKNKPLSATQKQENKEMSSQRVTVENCLGNQKRYFILRNENRSANRKKIQEEIWICAGLANFKSNVKINC